MYQSVDDIEEQDEERSGKTVNRLKVLTMILLGLTLLGAIAIWSSENRRVVVESDDDAKAVLKLYGKALTETSPALRRARLIDFINTYPDHDRIPAAKAQLEVINSAEAKDWAALTQVVYNTSTSEPVKLAALGLYEDIWGTQLLGGREADMEAVKLALGQEIPVKTDDDEEDSEIIEPQDFTPPPDQFDDAVSDTEMAGGIVIVENAYIPPSIPVETLPGTPNARIKGPTIRKNVKPRYPKRALRKDIEGIVVLSLNIDEDGEVRMAELVSARALKYRKDFVKAAERAAMRTKFHPKTVNGEAVPAMGVTKRYVFKIDN